MASIFGFDMLLLVGSTAFPEGTPMEQAVLSSGVYAGGERENAVNVV